MDIEINEILLQALKALYLIGVPIVVVVFLASSLTSLLQSAMAVSESSVNYAVRLVAFVLLIYLLAPTLSQTLLSLAELAFR